MSLYFWNLFFCVFIYPFVYVVVSSVLENNSLASLFPFPFPFPGLIFFPRKQTKVQGRGKYMRILKGNLLTNECVTRGDDAGVEKKSINPELWQACAGPLVNLPAAGTHVVYFPQGHSEQVSHFLLLFCVNNVNTFKLPPPFIGFIG